MNKKVCWQIGVNYVGMAAQLKVFIYGCVLIFSYERALHIIVKKTNKKDERKKKANKKKEEEEEMKKKK